MSSLEKPWLAPLESSWSRAQFAAACRASGLSPAEREELERVLL
jgi:hypothetical protein